MLGKARVRAASRRGFPTLWGAIPVDSGWVGMSFFVALEAIALVSGCRRGLPPSSAEEDCEATCAALLCYTPDLGDEVLDQCQRDCKTKLEESTRQGPSCRAAFEDGLACLAHLSCEEFMDWYTSSADDPCPSVRMEVESVCQGLYLEPEILPP